MRKTLLHLSKLPNQTLQEVSDFAEARLHKIEEKSFNDGIHQLQAAANSFDFLAEEEDLYSDQDLIEKYID